MNKAEIVFNKIAQGYNGPGGQIMKSSISSNKGIYSGKSVLKFNTGAGRRYYMGQGSSKGLQMSLDKATFNARTKFVNNPADSMTTKQFNLFK